MKTFISRLPEWAKAPLRYSGAVLASIPDFGNERFCPVCGKSSRRFRTFGSARREDAQCLHCGALERHRLAWLFLEMRTDLFDGKPKRVLHVAPELPFESRLRKRVGSGYLTADLHNSRAMVKMDITNINYPDQSFDVIYCSHVLEHVPDDRKAMREFHRILKDSGWAVLLVPITAAQTMEDPSIVDPQARIRAFGQADHVRRYGPDYLNRLIDAGFAVEVISAQDLVQNDDAIRMGIADASGKIYYCRKQSTGG